MKGSVEQFELTHKKDILVKAKYKEKLETTSGILITVAPSIIEERPLKGEVYMVGEKVTEIKVGDIAHFERQTGMDIYFDDNKDEWYILMSSKSVIGIERWVHNYAF